MQGEMGQSEAQESRRKENDKHARKNDKTEPPRPSEKPEATLLSLTHPKNLPRRRPR